MSGSRVGRRTLLCAACGVAVTACGGTDEQPDAAAGSGSPSTAPGATASSETASDGVTRGTEAPTVSPDQSALPSTSKAPPSRSASPGDQPSSTGPSGTPKTPTPSGPPTASPTAPTSQPPTQPANYLGPTSEVPVGGGKVYTGRNVVVTQPSSGRYVGMTATCPHQGREVGAVTGGVVECGYHGSLFSIQDGSVVNGPATKGLEPVAIEVSEGQISLAD